MLSPLSKVKPLDSSAEPGNTRFPDSLQRRLAVKQTSRMNERLSYEDSFRFLQREGWEGEGDVPPIPERPPAYEDEELGLSFFRSWVNEAKMEHLTIPRTYFSRSTVSKTSFANTDLTESVANWNDFEDVNFSTANLTRFDFRGCVLRRIQFREAILAEADLRFCTFEDCNFQNADLMGAKITREAGKSLVLSTEQETQIAWQEDDGPEPGGG